MKQQSNRRNRFLHFTFFCWILGSRLTEANIRMAVDMLNWMGYLFVDFCRSDRSRYTSFCSPLLESSKWKGWGFCSALVVRFFCQQKELLARILARSNATSIRWISPTITEHSIDWLLRGRAREVGQKRRQVMIARLPSNKFGRRRKQANAASSLSLSVSQYDAVVKEYHRKRTKHKRCGGGGGGGREK